MLGNKLCSRSVNQTRKRSVNKIKHSHIKSDDESTSPSVSESVRSQLVSQSESVSQPVSQSVSQIVIQSVSHGHSLITH